ncbi:MAG: putative Ig domain-containing protein, partial [Candidatus Sumerlaeota bacterium]|nr:putative Ig domain-containing protein [Candidatus Sumerlaeota bacterium]
MMEKRRHGIWFFAVVAVAVISWVGAGTALAGDAVEDFTLNSTGGNVTIVALGGSDTLIDCAGLTYDWGAYDAGTVSANIRIQQTNGMQMRQGAAVPGSYFLTRFTSGDSAVVNNLEFVDVTENNTDFDARLLVRDHATGAWYASATVSLVDAKSFDADTLQWAPVTNAQSAIEDAINIAGTLFTTLNIGSLGAWPAGLDVDGGGLYVDSDHAADSCRIARLAFKEPIPGSVPVPDVVGQDKTAAAAAIVAVGLVANELTPKANNDIYLNDQVISTSPLAGIQVAPGSTVDMTISGGPDEFWDWTGGAGPADVSNQANWTLAGTDLTVPPNPYAPPIDAGERVAVRNSTTWNAGSLSYGGMNVIGSVGSAVVNVSGATLSNTGATQIGAGNAALGTGSGTIIINAGSTVTCSAAINIGTASAAMAGNGTLEVTGGTLTLNTTGGAVNIGALNQGAGDATGLFHLNGSAATVLIQRAINLAGPLSTIKWTADAVGFCKIAMDQTNRNFTLNAGAVAIDATNAPVTVGTAASFQLLDCGASIIDNGNVLTSGVTITPKTGTSGGDWALEARDTDANSIPDELWLVYTPHVNNPPAFTNDPFSKPSARTGIEYNQSIAGDASDPDVGNTLTFAKVSGPPWLSVAADGALTGTPSDGDLGENTFEVSVTDQGSLSDTATMTILVSNVSAAKTWTE